MPIEVGVWRLNKKAKRISFEPMPSEKRLEDIIADDISILDPNLILIGRQVPTSFGKVIDLLAMDADGRERGITGTQLWAIYEDHTMAMRDGNVQHGITDHTKETDTFFQVTVNELNSGGTRITGAKDGDGAAGGAIELRALLAEDVDTTKTTAGRAIIELSGYQGNGTGIGNTVADGNVLSIRTYRGGAVVTIAIFDEDGDFYYNGTLNNYDAENDALAVLDLQRGLTGRWEQALSYNKERFQELGILGQDDGEGTPLVSSKAVAALMMGAVGQLYEKCQGYEAALKALGM